MKANFHGEGVREIKSWSCPHCKNYHVTGMDTYVDLSIREHEKECPPKTKIDHNEIYDLNFYSVSGRLAVMIEEALHRGRKILHTSITGDDKTRFWASIIWQEKE